MEDKEQMCQMLFYWVSRKDDHLVREMLGEVQEVLARYPQLDATLEEG